MQNYPNTHKYGTGGSQPRPKEVYLKGSYKLGLNSSDIDIVWVRFLGILYPNSKLKTTQPSSTWGVVSPVLKKF